jgi:hypothetical protein
VDAIESGAATNTYQTALLANQPAVPTVLGKAKVVVGNTYYVVIEGGVIEGGEPAEFSITGVTQAFTGFEMSDIDVTTDGGKGRYVMKPAGAGSEQKWRYQFCVASAPLPRGIYDPDEYGAATGLLRIAAQVGDIVTAKCVKDDQAYTAELRVVSVDLDLTCDGNMDCPPDGVENFLPGYQGANCAIFEGQGQMSWQTMDVLVEGLGEDTRAVSFELVGVSTHTGVCCNWGEIAGDDVSFSDTSDDRSPKQVVPESGEAAARLYCKDFGAQFKVKVTMGRDKVFLEAPLDSDGDGIADVWEEAQGAALRNLGVAEENTTCAALAPSSDSEAFPAGNPNVGDGLCMFDEYRGFVIGDNHRRTAIHERDLFLTRIACAGQYPELPDPTAIWTQLGYRLHDLQSTEYVSAAGTTYRGVNPNGRSGVTQYCVVFQMVDYDEGTGSQTMARIFSTANPPAFLQRGIPATVGVVRFYRLQYMEGMFHPSWISTIPILGYTAQWRQNVSRHELGHCVWLDHGQTEQPPSTDHATDCIMLKDGYRGSPTHSFCGLQCLHETKVK